MFYNINKLLINLFSRLSLHFNESHFMFMRILISSSVCRFFLVANVCIYWIMVISMHNVFQVISSSCLIDTASFSIIYLSNQWIVIHDQISLPRISVYLIPRTHFISNYENLFLSYESILVISSISVYDLFNNPQIIF